MQFLIAMRRMSLGDVLYMVRDLLYRAERDLGESHVLSPLRVGEHLHILC